MVCVVSALVLFTTPKLFILLVGLLYGCFVGWKIGKFHVLVDLSWAKLSFSILLELFCFGVEEWNVSWPFDNFLPTFSQLSHNFLPSFSQLSNNFLTTFSQLSHSFLTTFSQLSHNFLTTFLLISCMKFSGTTFYSLFSKKNVHVSPYYIGQGL